MQNPSLPPNVLDSLKRGETIEAIRRLCDSTGLGLKESMDVIDGHVRRRNGSHAYVSTDPFPAEVDEALQRGNKIAAIKMLRLHWGIGLKEAKDAVDARMRSIRPSKPAPAYAPAGTKRSPMDVILWIAGLTLVGYAIYYFLGYAQ